MTTAAVASEFVCLCVYEGERERDRDSVSPFFSLTLTVIEKQYLLKRFMMTFLPSN